MSQMCTLIKKNVCFRTTHIIGPPTKTKKKGRPDTRMLKLGTLAIEEKVLFFCDFFSFLKRFCFFVFLALIEPLNSHLSYLLFAILLTPNWV